MNYITLPTGRAVRTTIYAAAWKSLKAMPASALVPGFDYFPERADVILRKISEAATDRINRKAPPLKGRNATEEAFFELRRLAAALNTRRVIRRPSLGPIARRVMDARFPSRYFDDN